MVGGNCRGLCIGGILMSAQSSTIVKDCADMGIPQDCADMGMPQLSRTVQTWECPGGVQTWECVENWATEAGSVSISDKCL